MKKFFEEFVFPGACKYRVWMLLPAVVLVALDQVFKYLAVQFLREEPAFVLVDGIFELVYVENTGAAFNILNNQRWFFIIVTSVVMLFLLAVILSGRYRRHPLLNVSFVLVLSGGIGNLIDRIVHGYVIDYLYFKWIDFPVFNFADCCLVIGAIFMLIFFFFVYEDNSAKKTSAKKGAADDEKELDNA